MGRDAAESVLATGDYVRAKVATQGRVGTDKGSKLTRRHIALSRAVHVSPGTAAVTRVVRNSQLKW